MDRRCCCRRKTPPCLYFEDKFDRPNSPDLGPRWNAPDWQIDSQKAVTSTGGLALCKVRHPVPDESMCVSFFYEIPDYSVRIRAIVNAVDADNYLFADFDFANQKIILGCRSGGAESTIREVPHLMEQSGLENWAWINFSSTHLFATLTGVTEFGAECASMVPKGYYCGFYADAGVKVTWFRVAQHNRTWHKYGEGDCCTNVCQCVEGVDSKGFENWYCVPRSLLATFTDVQGDMAGTDMDGFSFTLTNPWDIPWGDDNLWEVGQPWADGHVWDSLFQLCEGHWLVLLGCPNDGDTCDCTRWKLKILVMNEYHDRWGAYLDETVSVASCSCNPLVWELEAVSVYSHDPPRDPFVCFSDEYEQKWGSFKIVITETPP